MRQPILLVLFHLTVALTLVLGPLVEAKDLSERLGIGYTNQFGVPESMPSISARYYPNQQYGIQGSVGVDTEQGANRFGAAAKFIKIVFREDNMNFYVAAGGGLVSRELNGST